jgi:hypothetical protein
MLPDDPKELLQRLMETEVAVAELKSANKLLKGRLADKQTVLAAKDAVLAAKEAELQARLEGAHMKWQQENTAFARTNAELMLHQGTYVHFVRYASYGWRMESTPTLRARER